MPQSYTHAIREFSGAGKLAEDDLGNTQTQRGMFSRETVYTVYYI